MTKDQIQERLKAAQNERDQALLHLGAANQAIADCEWCLAELAKEPPAPAAETEPRE